MNGSRKIHPLTSNWKLPKVTCGVRIIRLRTRTGAKVRDWVAAINDAGLRPPEGWCHPHRFGSFAPPRGMTDDGSQAQWFVDGKAAFEAIASSIEDAKSEVSPFPIRGTEILLLRLIILSFWLQVSIR